MTPTEREQAIQIANKALDVPNADPDDDLRTVSRQFLRSIEQNDKVRNQAIDACKQILKNQTSDHSRIVTVNNILNQMEDLKNETI